MNYDKLQEVITAIETDKKMRFDMSYFHSSYIEEAEEGNSCGTVACVAGYAYALAGKPNDVFDGYEAARRFFDFDASIEEDYRVSRELFFAGSMFTSPDDGFSVVSDKYQDRALEALKWMHANKTINWKQALTAIGAIKEMPND